MFIYFFALHILSGDIFCYYVNERLLTKEKILKNYEEDEK